MLSLDKLTRKFAKMFFISTSSENEMFFIAEFERAAKVRKIAVYPFSKISSSFRVIKAWGDT